MTPTEQQFISSARHAATQSAKDINFSPSLTRLFVPIAIAQTILESGWGNSVLYSKCNNGWGIKWVNLQGEEDYTEYDAQTREYVNGAPAIVTQAFKCYKSLASGFADHAKLLMLPRYAPVWEQANLTDACTQLMMCGYSTDRPPLCQIPGCIHYARRLMQLINEFGLDSMPMVTDQEIGQ